MPGARFSEADRVALHTVDVDDASFLQEHANDPRIRRPMTFTGPTSLAEQESYIEEDGDGAQFLITVSGEETGYDPASVTDGDPPVEPIGYAVLFDVDLDAGCGTIAYWITPPAQGEGYMTEAARLLLEYAFGQRRLNRIEARTLADNEASQGLLRTLGFVEEGVEREAKFVAGEHRDVVRYAMLSEEWG